MEKVHIFEMRRLVDKQNHFDMLLKIHDEVSNGGGSENDPNGNVFFGLTDKP